MNFGKNCGICGEGEGSLETFRFVKAPHRVITMQMIICPKCMETDEDGVTIETYLKDKYSLDKVRKL